MKSLPLILIVLFGLFVSSPVNGEEMKIKTGNIVHITVLGYPELSKAVVVRSDGSTDYPLLSGVPIDGMTVRQLQDVLQPILARFVERPRVFISIAEYFQVDVTIEGQVKTPGSYTVKGPISLQGVISVAGGLSDKADLRNIKIYRQGSGSKREITIDLYKYFENRDEYQIPDIENDDIIFVPMQSSVSVVRVMGSVRSPGQYTPHKSENIADMINFAGGSTSIGNMNHVIFISRRNGKVTSEVIKLKDLINQGLTDQIPLVQPGDIVVVSEFRDWQKSSWWISILRETALLLSSAVIIYNISR
ncbi:MAG: SLBB domain-containing protein [Candidatus Pacebacteria bacterium]|nr:SLBB domain-containing protein [Candidatus Paceibacterota bacterium]